MKMKQFKMLFTLGVILEVTLFSLLILNGVSVVTIVIAAAWAFICGILISNLGENYE